MSQVSDLKRSLTPKIANFSVDLPDAAVAIQVSGMFGSRQEEAQRLLGEKCVFIKDNLLEFSGRRH